MTDRTPRRMAKESPMRHLLFAMMLGSACATPIALTGCEQDGPAEKIGEGIDEAVENNRDGGDDDIEIDVD